jgi:tetratricopeptide (TPR) repeat protein
MMMMGYNIFFTIFLSIFITVSCGKKGDEEHLADKTKVQILLNSSRYDEAIELIDEQMVNDPNDPELRLSLASAYMGKANIDIYSLYPILELKILNKPAVNWDSPSVENPYKPYILAADIAFEASEDHNNQQKELFSDLLTYLWSTYEVLPLIYLAPAINDEQKDYAKKALDILDSSQFNFNEFEREANLNSALIAGSLTMNSLRHLFPLKENLTGYDSMFCSFSISSLDKNFEEIDKNYETFLERSERAGFNSDDLTSLSNLLGNIHQKYKNIVPGDLIFSRVQKRVCFEEEVENTESE